MATSFPSRNVGRRAMLVCAASATLPGWAQPGDRVRDTLVKAAFLHKFPNFVEWPAGAFESPEAPVRIGVIGDDDLLRDLRELARDRPGEGRPVVAARLQPGEPWTGYHLVYIRGLSAGRAADLLAAAPEGVLTVVDSDGQHPPGAVLSFYVDEGRVRFGASVSAATRRRLRLSSRLLSIARQVGLAPHAAAFAMHRRGAGVPLKG